MVVRTGATWCAGCCFREMRREGQSFQMNQLRMDINPPLCRSGVAVRTRWRPEKGRRHGGRAGKTQASSTAATLSVRRSSIEIYNQTRTMFRRQQGHESTRSHQAAFSHAKFQMGHGCLESGKVSAFKNVIPRMAAARLALNPDGESGGFPLWPGNKPCPLPCISTQKSRCPEGHRLENAGRQRAAAKSSGKLAYCPSPLTISRSSTSKVRTALGPMSSPAPRSP